MTAAEIKFIKKLHQKKYRKEEQKYFVEGRKLYEEALKNCPDLIESVYYTKSEDQPENQKNSELISEKEMSRISALKNPSPFLVLLKMSPLNLTNSNRSLFLEDIKDPGNMGTIIRSADWFGIEKIYVSSECVDLYNPKVIQATMGSFFRVNFEETTATELASQSIPLYGATLDGESIHTIEFPDEVCLVIGNESKGIQENTAELLTRKIFIPGKGKAESLNASVAAGIVLFAMNR